MTKHELMGFDEWMAENYSGAFYMPHPREAYEAGQQSKQAEIDELQKWIDKAVDYADGTHSENWQETINTMLHILRGGLK